RANSAPNEVTMEELHSELSVIANFSTLKMRASATSKMVTKGIKYVQIDVAQNIAFPLNEAAEMGGGSNVSDRAGWRVSVAFEIICERIECGPLIPPRKRLNDLGAEKKLSNMGSPCWVLAIDGQHQRS